MIFKVIIILFIGTMNQIEKEKFRQVFTHKLNNGMIGMNVVILPEVVDAKMRFLGAVDCDVIRNGWDIEVIEKENLFLS